MTAPQFERLIDSYPKRQGFPHFDVVDDKLVESVWHHVTRLLVGAISDAGHEVLTFEPSPHSVVNSLRLPPV